MGKEFWSWDPSNCMTFMMRFFVFSEKEKERKKRKEDNQFFLCFGSLHCFFRLVLLMLSVHNHQTVACNH